MQILKVISLLLDYPTELVHQSQAEFDQLIQSAALSPATCAALQAFVARRTAGSLLDWQSEYDGLFERGRSLSLFLFEHVHGESRDRGQAMVDLMAQYEAAGLAIDVKELPDYIPLYLEFLATQGEKNARLGLQEISHILALLLCRLEQRDSDYAAPLQALLQLSGAEIDLGELNQQLGKEARDDTPQALDKVWEEEAVMFTADSAQDACSEGSRRPAPAQRRDQEQVLEFTQSPAHARAQGG
jgi:nitrate reductase molybdenum cofactor assembly chaperone NarJ/NarW